jgi:hypothetical protein
MSAFHCDDVAFTVKEVPGKTKGINIIDVEKLFPNSPHLEKKSVRALSSAKQFMTSLTIQLFRCCFRNHENLAQKVRRGVRYMRNSVQRNWRSRLKNLNDGRYDGISPD